jgi:hypothetical protein
MGIKFQCANGHKLHVKSFLAGKKGRCPKCNVQILVPAEEVPLAAQPVGARPNVLTADLDEVEFGDSSALPGNKSPSFASPAVVAPQATTVEVLQDPLAVWYVHLPTGQQLGPAGGREMQRWLQQGGVLPGALVWRDGWPEWLPVSEAFPQYTSVLPQGVLLRDFPQSATAATVAAPFSAPPQELELGVQSPVPSATMFKPRSRRRVPVGAIFILMGLVVVLFALLLYVFVLR